MSGRLLGDHSGRRCVYGGSGLASERVETTASIFVSTATAVHKQDSVHVVQGNLLPFGKG